MAKQADQFDGSGQVESPSAMNEALGQSEVFLEFQERLSKVAPINRSVLFIGERGTGKELAATRLHFLSDRWQGSFITLNCSALSPSLIESELFGHEKGAFTGAYSHKPGKLELVGKGTLFLDEIGELTLACQAKLLTSIEYRTFERVGGTKQLYFEGRIIAATNRNLEMAVSRGEFREDLFYRLNIFRLKLPPLREHPEDIPLYIEHTLEICKKEYGNYYEMPNKQTLMQLACYPWPGNVRELIHHIKRITLFAGSSKIPQELWLSLPTKHQAEIPGSIIDLKNAVNNFKRQYVMKVLSECGGNQTLAANKLGVERTYLNRILNVYRKMVDS